MTSMASGGAWDSYQDAEDGGGRRVCVPLQTSAPEVDASKPMSGRTTPALRALVPRYSDRHFFLLTFRKPAHGMIMAI